MSKNDCKLQNSCFEAEKSTKKANKPKLIRSKSSLSASQATNDEQNDMQMSLIANDTNSSLMRRRGSGSGLALMRTLSSSNDKLDKQQQGANFKSQTKKTTNSDKQKITKRKASIVADNQRQAIQELLDDRRALELHDANQDLRAAFCVFDLDGDGFISIDEVRAGLKLIGEQWTAKELDDVFRRKAKADGKISVDEFVQFLL